MFDIHDYTNADVRGATREQLEAKFGQVWDTDQLRAEFEVLGFSAPYITAIRKSDGQRCSLEFTHDPRFYFNCGLV